MTTSPETSDILLSRMRNPQDRDAWYDFVTIYRAMIYRIGRRKGLQDADAENLVQEVLQKVGKQVSDWDDGKPAGGLRRWLATVARNAAIDALRRVPCDAPRGGTSVQEQLQQLGDREHAPEHELARELDREAFRWAARRIRGEFADSTWAAFWDTLVEGRSCGQVAAELGKSVGAVYTARSRVMRRLKEEVAEFDWPAEDDEQHSGGAR